MRHDEEIDALIAENKRRRDEIFGHYDPVTGEGCCFFPERVCVEIPDFFIKKMWVPKDCLENNIFKLVMHYGSIYSFIHDYLKREYTDSRAQLVQMELCKARMKEDPEFAMYICDKIVDKKSGEMIPFRLNYRQRRLLAEFEDMRRKGMASV